VVAVAWLMFGYRVQKRFWNELENRRGKIPCHPWRWRKAEEAITRDYFQHPSLSGQNDSNINEIEDRADAIRQAMIDDYQSECIIRCSQ
jgi:hypothetical protein